MDEIKDPPQTFYISGIRTRKSVGENQTPKQKPVDPKPADIHPKHDPLPSSAKRNISGRMTWNISEMFLKRI
jgi:hypothetical protein